MAAISKRVIPSELLRRSGRNRSRTSATTEFKCEPEAILEENNQNSVCIHHDSNDYLNLKQERHSSHQQISADGYLLVDELELDLERTLLGGQSFRWTRNDVDQKPVFTGVVGQHALRLWRCDRDRIAFEKLNIEGPRQEKDVRIFLEDYFQLKYRLKDLYQQWSAKDGNLKKCCKQYSGFRILRQDPVENLFSFICATCNNIKRISQMIDKMCTRFGDMLESKFEKEMEASSTIRCDSFRSFPQVERLAVDDVFHCLRFELGFGYRAKFITETANRLTRLTETSDFKSPREYLLSLRQVPYKETCKQLQQFPGVGRKVADCICLMSMDHLNAIPVDCHIYEIFCRNYRPELRQKRKSITETVHDLIGSYFTDLHGPLAGWSTSVLFVAELKHLKSSKSVDELLEKNWSGKRKNIEGDDKPNKLMK